MAERTKIQWADSTWDPWRGCTKVSPGCLNCYAEALAKRNPEVFGGWGPGAPRVVSKSWPDPVAWNRKAAQRFQEWENRRDGSFREAFDPQSIPPPPKPPWVFPSKCDWLDEEVGPELRLRFLQLIHETPFLRWLLLTKRPGNFTWILEAAFKTTQLRSLKLWIAKWLEGQAPRNVYVGASVEDQARAEERWPKLLAIPAVVRFLSCEPLLGPINLPYLCFNGSDAFWTIPGLDWVIIGGESGNAARPMKLSWMRDIRVVCQLAGVPVFVKQLGTVQACTQQEWQEFPGWKRTASGLSSVTIRDPKGGDPDEWPEQDRVRQLPKERT